MPTLWKRVKARIPHRYKYGLRNLEQVLRTGRPFQQDRWTIGMYAGPSPLELEPLVDGPVLTPEAVSDRRAAFVADPFMLREGGTTHLLFEIWNRREGKGEIAHATSADLRTWAYHGVVLAEPFHLSYPLVFSWKGEHYLVPESHVDASVRLYRAVRFPSVWALDATLLRGRAYTDPTVFTHDGRWWLMAGTSGAAESDTLRLFVAEDLHGPWREHPASPVVEGDAAAARPAGRVTRQGGELLRYAQDCSDSYGRMVRAFRITTLTPTEYREEPVESGAVLEPGGQGWNGAGMHHLDAQLQPDGQWVACVDGR